MDPGKQCVVCLITPLAAVTLNPGFWGPAAPTNITGTIAVMILQAIHLPANTCLQTPPCKHGISNIGNANLTNSAGHTTVTNQESTMHP